MEPEGLGMCANFAHMNPQRSAPADVGRRITEARRDAGITQRDLAEAASIERTALAKIERGRRAVRALELARVAQALGRPMDWFVGGRASTYTLEDLRRRRQEILRSARRHGVRKVWVFGSVARGDRGDPSDIDFLIEFGSNRSLFDHAALWNELEDLLGCPVDVVTVKGLRDSVRDRVLAEAIPL